MFDSQIVMEDSDFTILARIHSLGVNLTQAAVSTITYQIFYSDSDTAHTTATSLTVATVIYDTLQTDAMWTRDITGYNFRHDVDNAVLVDPTRDYKFEYLFTMADGKVFHVLIPPGDQDFISVQAIKTS